MMLYLHACLTTIFTWEIAVIHVEATAPKSFWYSAELCDNICMSSQSGNIWAEDMSCSCQSCNYVVHNISFLQLPVLRSAQRSGIQDWQWSTRQDFNSAIVQDRNHMMHFAKKFYYQVIQLIRQSLPETLACKASCTHQIFIMYCCPVFRSLLHFCERYASRTVFRAQTFSLSR